MDGPFADAVIVAAGSSARMDGVDKLQADVLGRPLLAWSVEAMVRAESVDRVVIVAAADNVEALAAQAWVVSAGASVVAGGSTRSASVLAGLRATQAEVVLVHDGARPLATPELADTVAGEAARSGAAIPVIPVSDSLKSVADDVVGAPVERDGMVAAQTPQAARRELLVSAFDAAAGASFTDEAALLAANGVTVATVAGDPANVKVTRPADLELVRLIARGRAAGAQTRTGYGQDSHQFGRHDGLWLGGVEIPEAPRLHGHSDGDVVLHAVATAILSGCGLGDIGRLFPSGDATPAGVASSDLLRESIGRAATAGWRPSAIQVALIGARPRLGARRIDAMRVAIAALAGLDSTEVSVTASTGNLSGAEGRGLAVSATAVVTMVRA